MRLDLDAIEFALRGVQRAADRIADDRDPMSEQVLANLLSGYAYLDKAQASGINLFARGYSQDLLELNYRVLCGADPAERDAYANHLAATADRFYHKPGGGIGDLMEWLAANDGKPTYERAAGMYIRLMSRPELFIEGNHRTGVLMISHLLTCSGEPPLVIDADHARGYFEMSARFKAMSTRSLRTALALPSMIRRFAELVRASANPRYLIPA